MIVMMMVLPFDTSACWHFSSPVNMGRLCGLPRKLNEPDKLACVGAMCTYDGCGAAASALRILCLSRAEFLTAKLHGMITSNCDWHGALASVYGDCFGNVLVGSYGGLSLPSMS